MSAKGSGGPPADAAAPPEWVERVLDAVESIPPGSVATYGDIGDMADCGPRQAGSALARYGSGVPWWRVLRADGTAAPGLAVEQLRRLRGEGVKADQRVDLSKYRARR